MWPRGSKGLTMVNQRNLWCPLINTIILRFFLPQSLTSSSTLANLRILVSFWKKKIKRKCKKNITRLDPYNYEFPKKKKRKLISRDAFLIFLPRRSRAIVIQSCTTPKKQRERNSNASPFRAPFNAETRPGRESFLSAEPAVTSIQSTRIRPPYGWYTQRRPLAALRACMHACMYASMHACGWHEKRHTSTFIAPFVPDTVR